MKKLIFLVFYFAFFSFASPIVADCILSPAPSREENPPAVGNFALPASQQFAPLLSFGQLIIGKDTKQLAFFSDSAAGHNQNYTEAALTFGYGISDDFTALLVVPYAINFRNDSDHSVGFQDITLQTEYALLSKKSSLYEDQATIVLNVSFPSGSAGKQPPTGFGAFGFFSGFTLSRMYTDWYLFTSYGIGIPANHRGTKFGNSLLYQFGIGRNICYIPNKMVFSWLLELDGTYTENNKIQGIRDPDSGGNVVYITPSLWLSFQTFYVQFGVGWVLTQHLFGMQNKNTYIIAGNLVWTF